MKQLLLIITVILCLSFQSSDIKQGWNDGYINGYCHKQEFCIKPIVPIMPIPRIQDTTYTKMYNRGFVAGLRAYKREN